MDPFFARNRLSAYLDGELSSGEAREVEDALAQSAELRAELDQLRAAIDLLRTGGPVPAPRGFADRLEARIAKEPMRVGWRRHFYGFRIEVGMLAAAAAIVIVFAARKPTVSEAVPEADAPAADAPVAAAGETPGNAPLVDAAGVPGVDNPRDSAVADAAPPEDGTPEDGTPAITNAPTANGVLGDESFAKKAKIEKAAKEQSFAPKSTKRSKSDIEVEPFKPDWEKAPQVPEPPPTVQAVAPFQFRLNAHSETALRDLAALAASLGGKLTDAKGREIAPYMMESGEARTVKLMLPSATAGAVASKIAAYGDIEVISTSSASTLYANGATVPVVIEVTAP